MSGQCEDLLYQAASCWKELTDHTYTFTSGYKGKLTTIHLTFSASEFSHLAGFQYLRDIHLPRYNAPKYLEKVLDHTITLEQIQESHAYENSVRQRLEVLCRLREILEGEFTLYKYMPKWYGSKFYTRIEADYLIANHTGSIKFLFIVKANSGEAQGESYLCCSAFCKGFNDFEYNQSQRSVLRKVRTCLSTQETVVLYNRLQEEPEKDASAQL